MKRPLVEVLSFRKVRQLAVMSVNRTFETESLTSFVIVRDCGITSTEVHEAGNADARHYDEGAKTFGSRHAYGVFWATAIPSTSLGSAGVCLGNTRALVACSKS